MEKMEGHKKATPKLFWGYGLAVFPPLNRLVFVKRKDNLLSAGADHVYPIIIVYKPVVWLFSCDLRDISIRYLPAAHPIKRWMSCHNHVTYAHSSGIRGRIYEKSALSIPYSPLMDYYFYTFANEERAYSRVRLMVFLHCLHWWIDISTLLQMENLIYLYPKGCVFPSSPTILILISGYIAILW